MVEFILRQRARGKVGHVDHEALDDGPYDDQQEQGRCYLNGAEPLRTKGHTVAHVPTIGDADSHGRSARPLSPLRRGALHQVALGLDELHGTDDGKMAERTTVSGM